MTWGQLCMLYLGFPAAFWVIAGRATPCTWLTNCWFYACKLTDTVTHFHPPLFLRIRVNYRLMYLEFSLIRPFLFTFRKYFHWTVPSIPLRSFAQYFLHFDLGGTCVCYSNFCYFCARLFSCNSNKLIKWLEWW